MPARSSAAGCASATGRRGEDLDAFIDTLNAQEIVPREFVTFSAHQMGTCRMGRDPATSVANPWGELHDTPGVWVGDASAFPSASGTNPMATIMALARRTAHAIASAGLSALVRAELEPQERFAKVGDLELCYEDVGDPDGEPLVLVMGLGTQLIHWNPELVNLLGDRGFRVIRFDNRDAGHSTKLSGRPPGTFAMLFGLPRGRAYHLDDMTDDVAGLLDELDLESAHLTGVSMGGLHRPGGRLPPSGPGALADHADVRQRQACRVAFRGCGRWGRCSPSRHAREEVFVERTLKTFEMIGSPGYPMDARRERGLQARPRAHLGPRPSLRGGGAPAPRDHLLGRPHEAPSRRARSDRWSSTATSDPLVRPAAGRALAKAIPGAEFELIEGMGHDMPPALFERFADAVLEDRSARRDEVAGPAGVAGSGVAAWRDPDETRSASAWRLPAVSWPL